MFKKTALLSLIFIVFFCAASAETCKPGAKDQHKKPDPWATSQIALGVNITTGNTNTSNYNGALDLNYSKNQWTNKFHADGQVGRTNDELVKQVYNVQDQVNYSFSNKPKIDNYVFASGNAKFDHFSPYTYQSVFAAGYGRDWVKTPKFSLSTQIGPGYRRNKDATTGLVKSSVIATVEGNLMWQWTSFSTFTQNIHDDYGKQYNYLKSTTSINNKLIGNLGVQIQYLIEYYSKIPVGSTNTKNVDTTLLLNIVYNF